MFLKAVVICIYVPEAFDILRDFRIDPVVISQNAIRVICQLLKDIADPIHMGLKIFIIHYMQIIFNICLDGFYRLFYILKVVVQVFLTCFA